MRVKVTGTIPEIENFTYEDQQGFTFVTLEQSCKGGSSDEVEKWTANYHTDESMDVRTAIVAAEWAIEDAPKGADTSDAESSLDDTITAYNGEQLELAGSFADKAKERAGSASKQARTSAQTNKLLLYGGAEILGLVIIGGVGY